MEELEFESEQVETAYSKQRDQLTQWTGVAFRYMIFEIHEQDTAGKHLTNWWETAEQRSYSEHIESTMQHIQLM